MRYLRNIGVIIIFGVFVAACGGGESDASQTDSTRKIDPIGFETRIGIIPASAN